MNKLKLFIENFLVYGVGGIISKVIPLIMVPIVTRLLPDTSYYGISDLAYTVASFGSAIAGLGLYDAMYRLFFEKEEENYKKDVCTTTLNFALISSIIVFVIIVLLKDFIAIHVFKDINYGYIVYISAFTTLVTATNNIIAAPTRMQNKRKIYLVTNSIGPILSYLVAIILILHGFYVIALPIGALVSGIIMEISFYILNRKWFKIGVIDKKLLKQLLVIGLPLLPNFLIYWVFNSSDKLMIVHFLSTGASGVYSVGAKFGHASQLIYLAFAGGWQFFAFSTMNEQNQVESNSNIFEYLAAISFAASVLVCAFSKVFFELLFTGEYVQGYAAAPYLFLAPLLQMLFQVACNQFLVIKKTWPNMLILLMGAVANVIINFTLIPILGIEGAAIATLIGYLISVIICVMVLVRMKLMTVSFRLIKMVILIFSFVIFWRLLLREKALLSILTSFIFVFIVFMNYKNEIMIMVDRIKKRKETKKNDNAE